MAPAGELWSTADDLCRLAAFLLDGHDRVLRAATLAGSPRSGRLAHWLRHRMSDQHVHKDRMTAQVSV
jgi:hypothetical protein